MQRSGFKRKPYVHWLGIEPGSPGWEARTLSRNYQCLGLHLPSRCILLTTNVYSHPETNFSNKMTPLPLEDGAHNPHRHSGRRLATEASGNTTKSGQSYLNIRISLWSAHTTTLVKGPFQLYNRLLQENIGNSSGFLV